jgi:hypothetical protein
MAANDSTINEMQTSSPMDFMTTPCNYVEDNAMGRQENS